jgi:hypothetical protein
MNQIVKSELDILRDIIVQTLPVDIIVSKPATFDFMLETAPSIFQD